MSKPISITDEVLKELEAKCKKNEAGEREETYSEQLKRLLKIKE